MTFPSLPGASHYLSAYTANNHRSFVTRLESGKDFLPPDFTIDDNDDDEAPLSSATRRQALDNSVGPDFIQDDGGARARRNSDNKKSKRDSNYEDSDKPLPRRTSKQPVIRREGTTGGASWMERNAKFTGATPAEPSYTNSRDYRTASASQERRTDVNNNSKTFRQDFRGTRVFVQGLPSDCSWQTLKDHFRVAGQVVFASVSADPVTGRSKGHGIVQFETVDEAVHAIAIMRNHPMDGYALYVREDVQENVNEKQLQSATGSRGPTPPTKWKCANVEDATHLDADTVKAIQQLLKARDQARRRRNYEASDNMREELRNEYGVQIDDRLTMWWTGPPPAAVKEIKGEGRWGDRQAEWRQIPTTLENDACVDPDLVQGLLKQRDVARYEKDFKTADALLEQARTAPDGDLYLRIHDESKTWRIWTEEPPRRPVRHAEDVSNPPVILTPAEQCVAICREHAPEKVDEVQTLLAKFPGREFNILKKLKQRYM